MKIKPTWTSVTVRPANFTRTEKRQISSQSAHSSSPFNPQLLALIGGRQSFYFYSLNRKKKSSFNLIQNPNVAALNLTSWKHVCAQICKSGTHLMQHFTCHKHTQKKHSNVLRRRLSLDTFFRYLYQTINTITWSKGRLPEVNRWSLNNSTVQFPCTIKSSGQLKREK